MAVAGDRTGPEAADFFISYGPSDQAWAEWVAWQLEAADYRVLLQAWDSVAGSNWSVRMDEGIRTAHRTIAILSEAYLGSVFGVGEWHAARAADPTGFDRRLVPVRVENCPRPGLLRTIVSIDLFGLGPDAARTRLLGAIRGAIAGRDKPATPPLFPASSRAVAPAFPVTANDAAPRSVASAPISAGGDPPQGLTDQPAVGRSRPGQTPLTGPRHPGQRLAGPDDLVYAVAFAAGGRLLAGASRGGAGPENGGTIRLWDVTEPPRPGPWKKSLVGHTDWVLAVTAALGGQLLASAGADGTVRLWDMAEPGPPRPCGAPLDGHQDWVLSVAFSGDGRILASAGHDGTVRLWDVAEPRSPKPCGAPLVGHAGWVRSVAFSGRGDVLASGSRDGTVRLWDVAEPSRARAAGQPLADHGTSVQAVVFSPREQLLASGGGDGAVRLWDVSAPARPRPAGPPIQGHAGAVLAAAFAPDGRLLASGGADGTVWLWDVTEPASPLPVGPPLADHGAAVRAVAFSPNGEFLASAGNDHTVRLWRL
ncbi:toll/interleukin-1 receptor domain-containing protein [Pseudofrankia inefficax]|uniref:WD40 repeat, subgroup n=1 Tax=Pseudofrankia inefficax (strain DSM 45817 / CECT 9037 / DDB 130130 / EuI1c) TaxID=298654 RepID=E3IX94_PSEI1|nr:TIR domain-containing protein [Pseudofrankia inefficax]ADP84994.1 WD40 repeat, subgroup [Pseudofrankia inefficax]